MGLILMYIKSMIGYMIVAIPFYIIGRLIFIKKSKRLISLKYEVLLTVFILYLVGLASQTIIPSWDMGVVSATGEFYFNVNVTNALSQVNLIPFNTLLQYFYEVNVNVDDWNEVSILNISANTLLFAPLGFLVPLIWRKMDTLKKVFLVGLIVTVCIEFVQYFIGRSSDIDDVILNTLGVVIGYGFFSFLFWIYNKLFNNIISQKEAV